MAVDYTVVVRGRKRKPATVRALVAKLAPITAPEDDEDDADDEGLDLLIDGLGSIEIDWLLRGYELSVDGSRDGNRHRFVELGELVDRIAAALGTVVEGDEATELLDETDAAKGKPPELASTVVIALVDRDGNTLASANVYLDFFAGFIDGGGMPSKPSSWKPAFMTEDYCYEARAKTMTALLHDSSGAPFRRYVWPLDGYGRIAGVDIEEL